MSKNKKLQRFAERIGHAFENRELLARALSHPSVNREHSRSFQRLEFLGDRVLGLVIVEALHDGDPTASEGQLAERLNALVSGEACARVARGIGIESVLRFDPSVKVRHGGIPTSVLADAMEAVIAAVYRDGGYDAARAFVLNLWDAHAGLEIGATVPNEKAELQDWALARGMPLPTYEEISRKGPDHAPVFTIRASLANGPTAQASGTTIRSAERSAAAEILAELQRNPPK